MMILFIGPKTGSGSGIQQRDIKSQVPRINTPDTVDMIV